MPCLYVLLSDLMPDRGRLNFLAVPGKSRSDFPAATIKILRTVWWFVTMDLCESKESYVDPDDDNDHWCLTNA